MDNYRIRPIFPLTPEEVERFRSRYAESGADECWPWMASRKPEGHGQCFTGGHVRLAHRVSWVLYNGREIPEGAVIRHTCDNPSCVNPKHLVPGAQADNMRDYRERGDYAPPPRFTGERHPMAKLTDAETQLVITSSEDAGILAARYGVLRARILVIWRKNGRPIGRVRNAKGQYEAANQ